MLNKNVVILSVVATGRHLSRKGLPLQHKFPYLTTHKKFHVDIGLRKLLDEIRLDVIFLLEWGLISCGGVQGHLVNFDWLSPV